MAWQLDTKQGLFLYIANLAVTLLSLCGSLWTCYFCVKAGSGKNTSLKFIVAITCADLMYSLTNLMSAFESSSWEYLCYFEGFVREFSLQLTLFFSSCLAILCYKVTKFGTEFDQEKFFRNSIILAAISSTLSNSAFFGFDLIYYTKDDYYCHLTVSPRVIEHKTLISIVFFGIPVVLGILITLISYIAMTNEIRSFQYGPLEEAKIKPHRLFWYPFIQLIVFGPRFLDSISKSYVGETTGFIIKTLHLISTHSIGFTNALVYGLQMKTYYQNLLKPDEPYHRLSIFLNE